MKDYKTVTDFNVTSAETDFLARIRLGSIVNLLVQSAINSADNMGFGFNGLKSQNLFWVLTRLSMEIESPLKWCQNIRIETWPKDLIGLMYTRDYIVRDENGQIIIRATSGWLAIDGKSMRPKTVKGMDEKIFGSMRNKSALDGLPERLNGITEGEVFGIDVKYYDIDLNKHVTSTRYIDWMMDTFPIDFHKMHYPGQLSVNYLKETKPDSSILLTRRSSEDDTFLFEGRQTNNNLKSFRGKIRFSKYE